MSAAFLVWIGWGLAFLAFEGYALIRHRDDQTLSWQIWMLERRAPWLRWAIAFFLTWLTIHFFTG